MATEIRAPNQIQPHPLNGQVYGNEEVDQSLRESIAQEGIITPLVIDQHDTILAGHRRWRAAQAVGLAVLPVVVREITDPLDGERILIESNRQREKTPEQRQREADELIRIIGAQAETRMRAGVTEDGAGGRGHKKNPVLMSAQGFDHSGELNVADLEIADDPGVVSAPAAPEGGKTIDRVAALVGVKRDTFRKERIVYQTATGQRDAPPEVRAVAEDQWARLNTGQTTVTAAEKKVRAAMHGPTSEQRQEAIAAATETHQTIMAADAALTDGGVAKIRLLREVRQAVTAVLEYPEDMVCAALEAHPHMDHVRGEIHKLRRWTTAIERRASLTGADAQQSG